ncbi:hypothetical protein JOQ06_025164 [Pogonophryne albipinna]|uniref:PPM-type phosphatase domain-containing protein n=1 Tax=Pogonophryne albipinna TaxID=1090488 RepID=A0AAD6FEH0_9TELE|nr:hypothetical protein JOQ06_025164 [Pogonophryne albipinna]
MATGTLPSVVSRYKVAIITLFLSVYIDIFDCQQFVIPFKSPSDCSGDEFFDISSLSCVSCGSNQLRSTTGLSCICKTGYQTLITDKTSITCQQCPTDKPAVITDGFGCVRCPGSLSDEGKCQCPPGNILGSLSTNVNPSVNYAQLKFSVQSAWFVKNLYSSSAACLVFSNLTACQALGNMCVMNMHSFSSVSTDACGLFNTIFRSRAALSSTQDISYWRVNLPWLYYGDEPGLAGRVLQTDPVPIKFSFRGRNKNTDIRLLAAVYNVRGEFLRWEQVGAGNVQLCPGTTSKQSAAFSFGTAYQESCDLSVADLLDAHPEPLFYDVFLDLGGGENRKLLPLPTLVYNQQYNGRLINQESMKNWYLSRRMFVVDTLSGREKSTSSLPKVIRVASSVKIRFQLVPRTQDGQVFPPLMTVTYRDVQITDINAQTVTTTFAVEYEMDQNEARIKTDTAIGVMAGVALIYSLLKTVSWKRRIASPLIDAETLLKFLIFYAGDLANVFFAVTVGTGLYWLIFYKAQQFVSVLLPLPAQEEQFVTYVGCAFALKAVQFLHKLFMQVSIDVFFIDWERPRCKANRTVQAAGEPKRDPSPVSIWRTYFVANEWNEIQTIRKISPTFQIMAVLFFLEVLGFSNLALRDPWPILQRSSQEYTPSYSIMLRYGLSSTLWLCIGFLQESLCGQRGLLPNSDTQTFQVSLTNRLRLQYDRIREQIGRRNGPSRLMDTSSANQFEQRARGYQTMNHFLGSVIDHAHPDMDYIVRDKLMFERVIGMEFLEPSEKSIFYNGNDLSPDEAHTFSDSSELGRALCGFEFCSKTFESHLSFDHLCCCSCIQKGTKMSSEQLQIYLKAASAMPVTSQLLRGLPRAKLLASGLLPCQQHQSQLGPITNRPPSRWPFHVSQSHQHSRSYQTTSELRSYILTPPQVNSILKANEYSFKVPEFDGKNVSSMMGFESNQLPANAPIEDRRSAATCLQTRGMLLGVFDGHAGCACAQALSERLFYYIAVSLLPHDTLCELEAAVEAGRALSPILQWHKHPNDYFSKEAQTLYFNSLRTYWQELIDLTSPGDVPDTHEALLNAFKRLDNDISLEAQVGDPNAFLNYWVLRVAFSGATACVAHIDGSDLYIANSGDARAVLGVQEEDGSFTAHTLSNDHSAQNEEEVARIRAEHPPSEKKTVIRQDRLLGLLMPLRAFGDVKFKWSIELQKCVLESGPDQLHENEHCKFIPPNYHTPPYLTAEPEITHHKLRPQDRFMVIGSDGLWETLHRQEVVRIVGEYITGVSQRQPLKVGGYKVSLGQMQELLDERKARESSAFEDQNSATHLIRHSVGNNEFGTVDHERLSKMLSLPEELARMYRDDITIIISQFNPHVIGAQRQDGQS